MKIIEILSLREEIISEKGILNYEILPFGIKKQIYKFFTDVVNPYYFEYQKVRDKLDLKYSSKNGEKPESYIKDLDNYLNSEVNFKLKFPILDNYDIEGFYPILFSLTES